jgi:hypothetical protein
VFVLLLLVSPITSANSLFDFCEHQNKETPITGAVADKVTATIKKIPETGMAIKQVVLINGIRAMDGEIASTGELKIEVDLDWQALSYKPDLREALDRTATDIIKAVFTEHSDLTKLRVLIKIPKNGKYETAAKVFSFTYSTWKLTKELEAIALVSSPTHTEYELTKNNPRFASVANFLALGDYVVLTSKGWVRGY